MPGPFYPLTYRELDWKLLLPLPSTFPFFLCWKTPQQTAEGKEKPLPGSRPAAWWELRNLWHLLTRMFFQAFWKVHPCPPPFSFPALISRVVGICPQDVLSVCWLALLLTEASRKTSVEISKTHWMCIFKCRVPFWHQTHYFSLFREFWTWAVLQVCSI